MKVAMRLDNLGLLLDVQLRRIGRRAEQPAGLAQAIQSYDGASGNRIAGTVAKLSRAIESTARRMLTSSDPSAPGSAGGESPATMAEVRPRSFSSDRAASIS